MKNSHCSYCGTKYESDIWPRHCNECNNTTWQNPIPVAVVLCPVSRSEGNEGLLLVRRSIEPHCGEWALPGGYLDANETWQEGAARELFEETGVKTNPEYYYSWDVFTSKVNGNLIIFSGPRSVKLEDIPPFVVNNEVSEIMVAYKPMLLAFPTHTEMMEKFFDYQEI